jgi:anti-anti-sigma factor
MSGIATGHDGSIRMPETAEGFGGQAGQVTAHVLDDGLVVRLSGVLDGQAVPQLRQALLRPLPPGCRDVLVDASDVQGVDDDALAVLIAGSGWVRYAGSRFAFTSMSPSLQRQVDELELEAQLPTL